MTRPPNPFDPPPESWIGNGPPSRNNVMNTIGIVVGVVLGVLGLAGVAAVVLVVVALNNTGNNK